MKSTVPCTTTIVSKPEIAVEELKTTVSSTSSNDSVNVPEPSATTVTSENVSVCTAFPETSAALSTVITAPTEAEEISTRRFVSETVPVFFTVGASPPPPPHAARESSKRDALPALLAFETFLAAEDHFFRKASRSLGPAGTWVSPSTPSPTSSPLRTSE